MARHWYSHLKQEAYSKWHRQFDGIAMIDVDAIEVCPHCCELLAIKELAKDTGQKFKAYTLTKKIADKFEVPGFVIFYTTDDKNEIVKFRVQRVSPKIGLINNNVEPKDWLQYLKQIQKEHQCESKIDESLSYGGTI